MPLRRRPRELKSYYNALQRCTTPIVCPHCNASLLPKHFEIHCREHHNFETKTGCAWCQRLTWPTHEKHKYGQHLLNCFKNFNSARLLDMTHPFPERDFFGHVMTHPDPMFDDTIEELLNIPASPLPTENLPPLPITFEDENLNFAASCVLFYLTGTHDFFHVMIKLVVYETFLEALNQDQGMSHTLPFSCWCDGGKYREPQYRQHRHAIVVSPKGHFRKRVWPRIKLPSGTPPPKSNFPCKKLKTITSPLYLVNVIGYLSQRESRCNFSFKESTVKRDNHFYLYRTLPRDFKLHLALLWPGGVLELLKQTKFQNVCIESLAQGILTHDGREWTQKIKDFYDHRRGLVICVSRDYVPTRDITPHFLHLEKGRKLYFEKVLEKLDPAVWLRKQIEGGNQFYDAVEESTWVPRPRDQKILNFHKPLLDKCRELESRLQESNHRCEELEESNRDLARENNVLRSKLEEMYLKISQLTDQVITSQQKEIARLEQENALLKSEIERLYSLN